MYNSLIETSFSEESPGNKEDEEDWKMKRVLLVLVLALMAGAVFASGNSEQDVRDEYQKAGGFPNRDTWLYEFNSIANKVVTGSNEIVGGKSFMPDFDKRTFDDNCVRYKVLLDIGVELKYITDAVRKQQTSKAEAERKKVSQYLASKSSGLGLE
jgi:hypothetical protein